MFARVFDLQAVLANRRLTGALAALAMLVSVAGCGGEKRVAVFPVSGKVSFQGSAPAGAQVVLHATSGGAADVAPTGTVKDDGSFVITSYEPGDGAPAGEYAVTVEWFKIVGGSEGGGRGPNVLPKNFAAPGTTPIKVGVSGPTEIPPIDVK